jgi:hypothetical protein
MSRLRTTGLTALAVLAAAPALASADDADVQLAAGTRPAAIQSAVDAFRADSGANNGAGPAAPSGRREIVWDGVPAVLSSPNALPPDLFRARGALLSTRGSRLAVSGNPGEGPVAFEDLDPDAPRRFAPFSPNKLFTAVGSTTVDVTFVVPGTNQPATTRGFGAVFTDVDLPTSTRLRYFARDGRLLGSFAVPASQGSKNLSFLGATFEDARVARVRITSGNARIGTPEIGRRDVVAMDDFIYGEPTN